MEFEYFSEINNKFDNLLKSWSRFKSSNEKRLSLLESRISNKNFSELNSDISRINDTILSQSKKIESIQSAYNRPLSFEGASKDIDFANDIEMKALSSYIRTGIAHGGIDKKAQPFQVYGDDFGSAFIGSKFAEVILKQSKSFSALRNLCNVVKFNSSELEVIIDNKNFETGSGWSLENTVPGSTEITDAFKIQVKKVSIHELYVQPIATSKFIQDANIDVGSWILEKAVDAFTKEENNCFLHGSGSLKPTGILSLPIVDYPSIEEDSLSRIYSNISAGIDAETLLKTIYSVDAAYLDDCSFLLHPVMLEKIRMIKDSNDMYIWQPAMHNVSQKDTIFGFPVYISNEMPIPSNGSLSVLFGNFKKSCIIADRVEMQALRDPFSYKPLIAFYITKRVGFSVLNSEPLRVIQLSSSDS